MREYSEGRRSEWNSGAESRQPGPGGPRDDLDAVTHGLIAARCDAITAMHDVRSIVRVIHTVQHDASTMRIDLRSGDDDLMAPGDDLRVGTSAARSTKRSRQRSSARPVPSRPLHCAEHTMFMQHSSLSRFLGAGVSLATIAMLSACSTKSNGEHSAGGSVDSSVTRTTSITPAAGPGVQVTRTDAASVTKATDYKLTDDNFSHFMAAADSLVALEGRDSTVRSYLAQPIADSPSTDMDAGLKWLESNTAVSNAINSAGISPRDYFVASIAIAAAERFMNDPKAAPPTPTLTENAAFLKSRTADLQRLAALREGRPIVTTTAP